MVFPRGAHPQLPARPRIAWPEVHKEEQQHDGDNIGCDVPAVEFGLHLVQRGGARMEGFIKKGTFIVLLKLSA